MATFPAYVIDVGAGADFTIFPFGTVNRPSTVARTEAVEYAKKYLHPKQISHAMYIVNTQKDFDAIIAKNQRIGLQAKIWRLENELAQAKEELRRQEAKQ